MSNSDPSTLRKRSFQLHSVTVGRDTPTPRSTPEPPQSSQQQKKRQHIQNFLSQKCVRARQSTFVRKSALWCVTVVSLLLSWAIGYFQYSLAALFLLVIAMVMIWRDQSGKIVQAVEQEAEIRLRRRKTVQHSETAEWVNLAINRWVTCGDSVVEFLRDYLEPLLQDMAPVGVESVQLLECDLSNQTPFVKNIQLFDPPSSTMQQPAGSYSFTGLQKITIMANLDIGFVAPDSRIVLSARLGGKKVGYNTLVYVEGINLSGSVQAVVGIDYEAPFPHIASLTSTFVRKPDIWFTVRILKGLKVTEVPLLKNWIHTLIMDVFTTLLVDPGKLTLDFLSSGPVGYRDAESNQRAKGVITVTIRGSPPEKKSDCADDPRRWCTLRLGRQKYQLQVPTGKKSWEGTFSFLVYNLETDTLIVKIKNRRVMRRTNLAEHSLPLNSLQLTNEKGDVKEGETSRYMHNPEANIALDFEYTELPPFSLCTKDFVKSSQVAGVLFVQVHSGSGLLSADADGLSDPYCVLLANKKKVMTTHYILDTLDPKWERGMEFFVADFTQVSLTFVVYDWDGPLVGDDLLGVAKFNMVQDHPEVLQRKLELEIDGSTKRKEKSLGHITVSVVFRPVDSVARAELPMVPTLPVIKETLVTENSAKKAEVKKVAKQLKSKRRDYYESAGVVELTVLTGRNLVPKDSNGLSDPYLIVKYGSDTMFRTRVVKKTLNPEWNESGTLSAPHPDEVIRVECWDKDRFTDDFMGSMQFTLRDLEQFKDGPKWCRLEQVDSGEILFGIKRILPKAASDQLDEALLDKPPDVISTASSVLESEFIPLDSDSDSDSALKPSTSGSTSLSASGKSVGVLPSQQQPSGIERRHSAHSLGHKPPSSASSSIHSYDDSGLPEDSTHLETQADIDRALKGESNPKQSTLDRRARHPTVYHNLAGQVIEAEGLKGKLDHLELYIKIRLNTRPSYQRQRRFDRGPVVHKTRVLRGSSNPQWREDFMVKESPVPSDSLLTLDLKSGSKVTLGTHAIPLERLFDGNMKATRWLDVGNDMKLRVRLTRQPMPGASPKLDRK